MFNEYSGDLKKGMKITLYSYNVDGDRPLRENADVILPNGSQGLLISNATVSSVRRGNRVASVKRVISGWAIYRRSDDRWGGDCEEGFILLDAPSLKELMGNKLDKIKVKKTTGVTPLREVKPCKKSSK